MPRYRWAWSDVLSTSPLIETPDFETPVAVAAPSQFAAHETSASLKAYGCRRGTCGFWDVLTSTCWAVKCLSVAAVNIVNGVRTSLGGITASTPALGRPNSLLGPTRRCGCAFPSHRWASTRRIQEARCLSADRPYSRSDSVSSSAVDASGGGGRSAGASYMLPSAYCSDHPDGVTDQLGGCRRGVRGAVEHLATAS